MSYQSPLQYYYTVDEEQELDPEIAADMFHIVWTFSIDNFF